MKCTPNKAFESAWGPLLNEFIASNWGKIYSLSLTGPKSELDLLIEDYFFSVAAKCIFNPDRKIFYRQGIYKVFDIYRYVSDEFLKGVKFFSAAPDLSLLTTRYDALFPVLFQTEKFSGFEGRCDQECPSLHLSAYNHLDQTSLKNYDHPLIARYLQYLQHIYTGDQNHRWKSEAVRRHGIPVLICGSCELTPFQSDLTPGFDQLYLDRIDVLTECRNYIASKFGAWQ